MFAVGCPRWTTTTIPNRLSTMRQSGRKRCAATASSPDQKARVDGKLDAGDVAARRSAEVEHGLTDVTGFDEGDRQQVFECRGVLGLLGQQLFDLRVDDHPAVQPRRVDGVYANVLLGEHVCVAAHDADNPMLGG